jgi:hypothetical protein
MPTTKHQRIYNDPYPLWESRNGDLWAVEELETDHLRKCILKIKFSSTLWRVRYLPLLEAELARRGISDVNG